jgi:hypothetical protein
MPTGLSILSLINEADLPDERELKLSVGDRRNIGEYNPSRQAIDYDSWRARRAGAPGS